MYVAREYAGTRTMSELRIHVRDAFAKYVAAKFCAKNVTDARFFENLYSTEGAHVLSNFTLDVRAPPDCRWARLRLVFWSFRCVLFFRWCRWLIWYLLWIMINGVQLLSSTLLSNIIFYVSVKQISTKLKNSGQFYLHCIHGSSLCRGQHGCCSSCHAWLLLY